MKAPWLVALCLGLAMAVASCAKEEDATTSSVAATAPEVTATDPADGDTSIKITKSPSVTFSLAMDDASLTTNEGTSKCTGSLQLTADSFDSCVALSATVAASSSGLIYTLTPQSDLDYATTYKLRVTTAALSADAAALETATTISFTTAADTSTTETTTTTTTTTTTNKYTLFSNVESATIYG